MTTHKIDITLDHCPMTFVKTKLELEKLEKGDQLEVTLKKGEPLQNVPKSAKEQGYIIHDVSRIEGDTYRILIEK
ncbi:MAG: sulfurtransferase TusA family protein [Spirochaetales bacterium]|jgi:TusA-related sulfurtransferase|nr:sulfurtransferase TusA family protein [Spirochaetales bacterium]